MQPGGNGTENPGDYAPQPAEGSFYVPDTPANAWQYKDGEQPPQPTALMWTASEFIAHDKSPLWFVSLFGGAAVISALVYLFTRDKVATAVIAFVAIVFAVFAVRKPRILQYHLDEAGLTIGNRFHPLQSFKYFAVVEEGPIRSILLLPLQRFMPTLSLYYPPEKEDAIVDLFGLTLPLHDAPNDPIDRLMHKLRF